MEPSSLRLALATVPDSCCEPYTRYGVAVSVMEGDYLRPLADLEATAAMEAAAALAGRRVPVAAGFVGR